MVVLDQASKTELSPACETLAVYCILCHVYRASMVSAGIPIMLCRYHPRRKGREVVQLMSCIYSRHVVTKLG